MKGPQHFVSVLTSQQNGGHAVMFCSPLLDAGGSPSLDPKSDDR
jgi:hypothetical protein